MNVTPTSEKLITELDRAAVAWGWQQAEGSGAAARSAETDYIEADAKLRKHVSALERKVRRLKQEIRALDGTLARHTTPDDRRDWTKAKAKAAISTKTIAVDILGTGILTEVPNPFYTP